MSLKYFSSLPEPPKYVKIALAKMEKSPNNFKDLQRSTAEKVNAVLFGFFEKQKKEFQAIHPSAGEVIEELARLTKDGKRLRPTMCLLGFMAGGGSDVSKALYPASAIEMAHLYLLIHDDIMDNASLRRFKPTTTHWFAEKFKDANFAASAAIMAGDIASTLSFRLLLETPGLRSSMAYELLNHFALLIQEVEVGQYLDVRLSGGKAKKTLSDIKTILTYKTARYSFRRPFEMGLRLAEAAKSQVNQAATYTTSIGIAYQIYDDLVGAFGKESRTGKDAGSDIREAKSTFLSYYAAKKASGRDRMILHKIYGNTRAGEGEIKQVQAIIQKTGARKKAQEIALGHLSRAEEAIESSDWQSGLAKSILLELVSMLKNKINYYSYANSSPDDT